jgi:hypothetical protein
MAVDMFIKIGDLKGEAQDHLPPFFVLLDRLAHFFCSRASALGTCWLCFGMATACASTVYEITKIPTPAEVGSQGFAIDPVGRWPASWKTPEVNCR